MPNLIGPQGGGDGSTGLIAAGVRPLIRTHVKPETGRQLADGAAVHLGFPRIDVDHLVIAAAVIGALAALGLFLLAIMKS